jgi:hypothetical protein
VRAQCPVVTDEEAHKLADHLTLTVKVQMILQSAADAINAAHLTVAASRALQERAESTRPLMPHWWAPATILAFSPLPSRGFVADLGSSTAPKVA